MMGIGRFFEGKFNVSLECPDRQGLVVIIEGVRG